VAPRAQVPARGTSGIDELQVLPKSRFSFAFESDCPVFEGLFCLEEDPAPVAHGGCFKRAVPAGVEKQARETRLRCASRALTA
jgi:hypothetical protein